MFSPPGSPTPLLPSGVMEIVGRLRSTCWLSLFKHPSRFNPLVFRPSNASELHRLEGRNQRQRMSRFPVVEQCRGDSEQGLALS